MVNPVLITGANGFIGRQLTRSISAMGIPVVGIGHGAIAPGDQKKLGLSEWVNGDVDHANLQELGKRIGRFECVFHLAGGSHVGRSFQNPAEDFHRTVTAGSQLLEWSRLNCPATPIIITSSAAVYGTGHSGPISEETLLTPFSPYGAHKAILESLAKSYCQNFGLKIAVARLFSVYGEGLEKQLVFDLCQKLSHSNGEIQLGGTGDELRDWIHVTDVAKLLWLAKDHCSTDCFVVNGGRGVGTSVADVVRLVAAAWGSEVRLAFSGDSRRGDPQSLVADVQRSKTIAFEPSVSEAGFKRVVDWYQSVRK